MRRALKVFGKIILALLILLLLAVLLFAGIRLAVTLKTKDRITPLAETVPLRTDGQPYDAIIVPGASVLRERIPSAILQNRLDRALELYRAGVSDKILLTGDHRPGEYDEVDVMWEYLIVRNVPEQAMVRDYNGFSTYESMVNAAKTFQIRNAVVVTQKYHLFRALYTADAYGIEAVGAEAAAVGSTWDQMKREARECAATLKDFWYCLIRKEI